MRLEVEKSGFDLGLKLSLQQLSLRDPSNPRFPFIAESHQEHSQQALIQIDVLKKTAESPTFANVEMDVNIEFGSLRVNWHPKSINRILRFFRYFKLVSEVEIQERVKKD